MNPGIAVAEIGPPAQAADHCWFVAMGLPSILIFV
jgi:hypothetical protein